MNLHNSALRRFIMQDNDRDSSSRPDGQSAKEWEKNKRDFALKGEQSNRLAPLPHFAETTAEQKEAEAKREREFRSQE
jgi:hypothetical protein